MKYEEGSRVSHKISKIGIMCSSGKACHRKVLMRHVFKFCMKFKEVSDLCEFYTKLASAEKYAIEKFWCDTFSQFV